MIEAFLEWLRSKRSEFERNGLIIGAEEPEPNTYTKRSAYVDIESPSILVRATVWESGECDLLALEKEGGREIMNDHFDFRDTRDLRSTLNNLIDRLSEGTTNSPSS